MEDGGWRSHAAPIMRQRPRRSHGFRDGRANDKPPPSELGRKLPDQALLAAEQMPAAADLQQQAFRFAGFLKTHVRTEPAARLGQRLQRPAIACRIVALDRGRRASIDHRKGTGSTFNVRCSMFDVRLPRPQQRSRLRQRHAAAHALGFGPGTADSHGQTAAAAFPIQDRRPVAARAESVSA
ncbi:MAG: hypothetical protein KY476_02430 [Planctomycetes bacterium]|nr:hypothetical protein [Planctomycetota bacterium]